MRLFSSLLLGFSALTALAQPGGVCDGLNAGFSFVPSGGGYQFLNNTTGTGTTTTWFWNFGDGTSSNNPQPLHEFPGGGGYEVCLTAISIYMVNGQPITCMDSTCTDIAVGGGDPCDDFEACFVPSQTSPGVVFFNNCTDPGTNTQYVWSFGDGSTGSGVAPTHTYVEPGTYVVCLTAYWNTCVDSTCTTIVVQGGGDPCDELQAGFTFTTSPNGVQFSNATTGTGTTTTWLWIFDDGTTSDNAQPFHTFPVPGIYEVCLKALSTYTDDNGATITCSDTYCANVTVQGGDPCDDFEACFVTNDLGDGVFFFDNCSSQQGNAQYVWNFGDGTTSTIVNVEHVYPQPGTYTVCLTAYWGNCVDSTCTTVVVGGGGIPCEDFAATVSWNPAGNNTIEFAGATTMPGAYITWSFGDGTLGYGPNVTHTYTASGQYQACLSAWYWNDQLQDSCITEECVWVTVGTTSPCDSLSANFWLQGGGTPGSIFYSAASGAGPHWLWSFGDGTFSDDGPQGVHTYAEPGLYHVCLTVFAFMPGTQDTCSVTSCQWITVYGPDPCDGFDATMTWNASGNNSATFAGTTTLPAVSMTWYFGDGTMAFGPTATHTYAAPGQYYVCFEAWYWNQQLQDSCATEDCQWITVGEGNPCDGFDVTISWNATGNNSAVFTGTTTLPAVGMIWYFGDGTQGGGQTVTHTYAAPGQYHVCLAAWYWNDQLQDSCWAESCVWITVGTGNPCDGLNANFTTILTGLLANFQNSVVNPQWTYSWSFGDGTTGGGPNPVHVYSGPGVYNVCLTIWTWDPVEQDTCFADHCSWLTIGGDPCDTLEACFQIDPISASAFQFLNCTSPEVGVQFVWNFGDGSTSTGVSPDHTYQEPGVYTVCLTAYWQNCVDSTCAILTVGSGTPCDSNFETDFTWTAQGTAVIFQGTSNLPANLLWFFGDGTIGNGAVVTHLYEPPGPYNVCLAAWYWNPQTQDTCWTEHCELIDPFDPTNGIVDAELADIRIYPQPASDVITIDGLDTSALLQLFGPDGRLVVQERAHAPVHHLDVADLATGVYVLHLDADGRTARYRIAVE